MNDNDNPKSSDIFPGFIDEYVEPNGGRVIRFKIYRPRSVYLLGFFITPLFIGYLTSAVILAITFYYLGVTRYSNLSLALALAFSLPLLLFLNFYVIRPSLKALSTITLVEINKNEVRIKNVFPNVIKGTIQSIPRSDITGIIAQEAGSLGYRLIIQRELEKNVPFGLFASKEDVTLAETFFQKRLALHSPPSAKHH